MDDAVFVPYRFMSDNGRCAIDVTIADFREGGDVSNGLAIARSAERIMQKCVAAGREGYTKGFSKYLSMLFRHWT